MDPELLKQLILTFKSELEENSQVISNDLLSLEKGVSDENEQKKIIERIFRSAHNLKGAARGIGINNIADIAHHIESLFISIQNNTSLITTDMIDIALEAVDKMNEAMDSFMNKKELSFNVNDFISKIEKHSAIKPETPVSKNKIPLRSTLKKDENNHHENEVSSDESVRVSIKKIDKISSLMEEIQVNKIAIDDQYSGITQLNNKINEFSHAWKQIVESSLKKLPNDSGSNVEKLVHTTNDHFSLIKDSSEYLQKKMRNQINELSILSNSLQEEVRMLRLVPARNFLQTLPRYVRDLSHSLNKQVDLEIVGDEVKMDKMIIEGLRDPINHLLRNAVDHGIEDPETRKKLGKSEVGTIRIYIKDEGHKISINVSDDGVGIDVNKIATHAESHNLISKDELSKMNKSEILQFIFRQGFTTKKIISDVSGRGVGLDVVKSNITDLKGQVTVSTELGKGTTFSLQVPLTLSSQRGLLIKCGSQLFVVPTVSVERVLSISDKDIVNVEGKQGIIHNKKAVQLYSLEKILNLNIATAFNDQLSVIIIKKGWQNIAFHVQEVIGEREIVIKPLRAPLSYVPCVAGGTLLETSKVVIVLNPNDLIQLALEGTGDIQPNMNTQATTKILGKIQVLVVDDSITTRTLEKNILESKDYQVTVAANGKEAWDLLQKQPFSLLITDISMPIMDGFELTERVKKSDRFRELPIIIVTSLGSDAEKKRGIDAGADAYIVKNEFESGNLLQVISQLV